MKAKHLSDCHRADCKHVNAKRTESQNSALHLYLEHVAQELNNAGFPIKATLSHYKVDLDWDARSCKELLWRPIQIALLGKTSTTTLRKQQDIDRVYEHINRFLSSEPFCLHIPFPNNPDKEGKLTTKAEEVNYPTEEWREPTI